MVVSCADDLGGQNGLLVSLDMYKELVWPYHKRLFQFLISFKVVYFHRAIARCVQQHVLNFRHVGLHGAHDLSIGSALSEKAENSHSIYLPLG